jgi:hypothetical protein
MQSPGEIGLGHAEPAPNGADRNNKIEGCEGRVGNLAVLDGMLADFVLRRRVDFCLIEDWLFRPQSV